MTVREDGNKPRVRENSTCQVEDQRLMLWKTANLSPGKPILRLKILGNGILGQGSQLKRDEIEEIRLLGRQGYAALTNMVEDVVVSS